MIAIGGNRTSQRFAPNDAIAKADYYKPCMTRVGFQPRWGELAHSSILRASNSDVLCCGA